MPLQPCHIHKDFRYNGVSFNTSDLIEVGYSLIKEGDAYEQPIGEFILDWLSPETTIKVHTSGSTGNPKPIAIKKQHMVNSALATAAFLDLKNKNTALLCLPTKYIAGKMMVVRAMVMGLHLDAIPPQLNVFAATKKNYDFCAMTPPQLEASQGEIDKISKLLVGGGTVSETLKKGCENKKTLIYETYGMTETVTHIALKRINPNPINVFKCLPKVTITTDKRDCLIIQAPHISDVPVRTNDLVELVSKSEFRWMGRHDNIINSGGIKLSPEHIEHKLIPLIAAPFFIAGVEDPVLGEKLILIIEGSTQPQKLLEKIKKAATLDKFEVPKKVYTLPQFVRTLNGKLHRIKTLSLISK